MLQRLTMIALAVAITSTQANSQMAEKADCMDLQTLAEALDEICLSNDTDLGAIETAIWLSNEEASGLLETDLEKATAQAMRNLADICIRVASNVNNN